MSKSQEVLERSVGFQEMNEVERRASVATILKNRTGIVLWDLCLELYVEAFSRPFNFDGAKSSAELASCNLRMNWLVMSARTTKYVQSGMLGAYYTQCFALLRLMSETWRRVVYVRLNTDEAWRFVEKDSLPDSARLTESELGKLGRWPDSKKIGTTIQATGSEDDRENDSLVRALVEALHEHAHPTDKGLVQIRRHRMMGGVGSFYDELDALNVQIAGVLLSSLLLHELSLLQPQPTAWNIELGKVSAGLGHLQTEWLTLTGRSTDTD